MSASPDPAAAPPAPTKPGRFNLAGAAVLAVLILAPSLLYPWGRDQSVFAYVGSVIARGGMPFRDAWDLKPPGIYLLYGLLAWLSPDDGFGLMTLVRVADIALAALTAVLLAVLARRWGRPEAGWAAGAWYAALYLQGGFWSLAQAEAWANPLLLAAACLCLAGSDSRRATLPYLAAGVLTGLAATLKITTVVPVAVFLAYGFLRAPRAPWIRLLAFAAGGAAGVGAALVWLQSGGALEAYVDIQRGFVAPYTRLNTAGVWDQIAAGMAGIGRWALQVWAPLLLVGTYFWTQRRDRASRTPRVLLGGAFAAAVAVVAVQSKFFLYHWETALPWLALLAGLGSVALLQLAHVPARRIAAAALAIPVAWSVVGRWSVYRDGTLLTLGVLPREVWLRRFRSGDDYSFLANTRAAGFVRALSAPEERVLIWGFEPSVYLLADRRPPTRFFFNVPVAVPFSPRGWKEEFLTALRRDPPRLFVVLRNDAIPWANGLQEDSSGQLRNWPDLNRFLNDHYRLEAEVEDFGIYRRTDGPPAGRDAGAS